MLRLEVKYEDAVADQSLLLSLKSSHLTWPSIRSNAVPVFPNAVPLFPNLRSSRSHCVWFRAIST